MDHKRGRGRPRIHDDVKLVSISFHVRPDALDTLEHRARQRRETVAAIIRSDLELVARVRAKAATRDV